MWSILGSVAAIIVPVSTVLWYCIRTEMRAQLLTLHLAVNDRVSQVEGRVTAIEARVATAKWLRAV
jgi:hypothetical protein